MVHNKWINQHSVQYVTPAKERSVNQRNIRNGTKKMTLFTIEGEPMQIRARLKKKRVELTKLLEMDVSEVKMSSGKVTKKMSEHGRNG